MVDNRAGASGVIGAEAGVRAVPDGFTLPMGNISILAESGYPGFDVGSWQGIVVPAGTPQPIIDKLNAVLVKILAEPGVKAQFAKQGAESASGTPAAFGSYITAEIARWKKVAQDAGVKPE